MRIHLKLSSSKTLIPFNYQHYLAGCFHKWLGENELHGKMANFSFSWLNGGEAVEKRGLFFHKGAQWFISSYSDSDLKKIIAGIMNQPDVAFGMKVMDITIQDTPNLVSGDRFYLGSPVFIKRTIDNKQQHFTYNDNDSDLYMTETLSNKLLKAGLPDKGIKVMFDKTATGAKTKLSSYRNIQNKVSYCPVIIEGSPQQLEFAWNVGVGNSTGIGYGSLQ